ncbi:MAG: copper resistance protein CopC [Gemmatimonadetes bacterium]|nr:copper resistance protein CopC [Gemmatimonadota bacterium]
MFRTILLCLALMSPLGRASAKPPALMHATLLSSEPAAKATLTTPPTRIRLVFSEEVEPSLGRIRLVAPDGHVMTLKSAGDPHDVSALIAPITLPLAPGAYRVEWRIVSEDGHPIDGAYPFTVAPSGVSAQPAPSAANGPMAGAAPSGGTATPAPAPQREAAESDTATSGGGTTLAEVPKVPAVLRALAIGALAAFAGLLGFLATRRTTAPQPRAARLVHRLAIATAILVPLHLIAWALAVSPDHSLGGDTIAAVLASGPGKVELARTVLALLAAWGLLLVRRERLALWIAVVAILAGSATGHSAAIHPEWGIPGRALHLLAIAAWLGGLLWLVTLDRSDASGTITEAQRVSSLALVAVIVVTFSGVVQTRLFLPVWGDLLHSQYGLIVLAKVAGVFVLVLFGAYHRFRVLPRLSDAVVAEHFPVSLRREIAVMSLLVLLGGLLAYLSPPTH